jgi:exportin-2 (importin alpha re-exporter)
LAAETFLQSVERQAGFSRLLLQLVGSEAVEMPVRQAGAVFFKNYIKRNWKPSADAVRSSVA